MISIKLDAALDHAKVAFKAALTSKSQFLDRNCNLTIDPSQKARIEEIVANLQKQRWNFSDSDTLKKCELLSKTLFHLYKDDPLTNTLLDLFKKSVEAFSHPTHYETYSKHLRESLFDLYQGKVFAKHAQVYTTACLSVLTNRDRAFKLGIQISVSHSGKNRYTWTPQEEPKSSEGIAFLASTLEFLWNPSPQKISRERMEIAFNSANMEVKKIVHVILTLYDLLEVENTLESCQSKLLPPEIMCPFSRDQMRLEGKLRNLFQSGGALPTHTPLLSRRAFFLRMFPSYQAFDRAYSALSQSQTIRNLELASTEKKHEHSHTTKYSSKASSSSYLGPSPTESREDMLADKDDGFVLSKSGLSTAKQITDLCESSTLLASEARKTEAIYAFLRHELMKLKTFGVPIAYHKQDGALAPCPTPLGYSKIRPTSEELCCFGDIGKRERALIASEKKRMSLPTPPPAQLKPKALVPLKHEPVTLNYVEHVMRWFERPEEVLKQDPKYQKLPLQVQRKVVFFHAFPQAIDQMLYSSCSIKDTCTNPRTEQMDTMYALPAEVDFEGVTYRGFFKYIIDSKTGACYHRCFSQSTHFAIDLVHQNIWNPIDFPTLKQATQEAPPQKMVIDQTPILLDGNLNIIHIKAGKAEIKLFNVGK